MWSTVQRRKNKLEKGSSGKLWALLSETEEEVKEVSLRWKAQGGAVQRGLGAHERESFYRPAGRF